MDVESLTGKMEQVQVGDRTIQSESLNALHLAVYHQRFEAVKLLCEGIPTLDLARAGRIPLSSGLANDSEASFELHHPAE